MPRIIAAVDCLHGLSERWVAQLLQRYGIRRRSGRLEQFSPDPEYEAKLAHLLGVLSQVGGEPDRFVALFMDQCGYSRWPGEGSDWAAAGQPVAAEHGPVNNRQQRIIGCLNALTGQVTYLDNYIIGREYVGRMYRRVDEVYPAVERIFVVQDNWSIHRHADVLAVLAKLPRLTIVPLPTYAPWLNPIEKLWRWLKQDVIKLHRLAGDFKQLRSAVNRFLDQFNGGSQELLRYCGLSGEGRLATALRPA